MSENVTSAADQSISAATRLGATDISEILRTFAASGWSGMRLEVGDVTIAVGKDGAPPESVRRQAAAQTAPAALESGERREPTAMAPVLPHTASAAAPTTTASSIGSTSSTSSAPPAPPVDEQIGETGLVRITSPTVGAFWVSPDPGSPPFVTVGDSVSAGDQLGIVEVMKLMNPVVSDTAGEVVAVRAANADMVEFGQTLFLIRADE